ncbi:MAG: pyruvate kinase [Candidatus Hydrogenedentes bacterium]|nr:pyruvate kinase [Candidatus Hydrogenedentota bacterium]
MRRRTKIVCTIGPASSSDEGISNLIQAGMNVARLNFSHGSHAHHRKVYERIRRIAGELNANAAILMDLQGPKIRTGPVAEGALIPLEEGKKISITTESFQGTKQKVSTSYKNMPQDVSVGDRILIADGTLELRVDAVAPPEVHCTIIRGGMLGSHKGINLPGVNIAEPCLTRKDRKDLEFGLDLGVDYVALSFVRTPQDIDELRAIINAHSHHPGIVAKIERPEALEHFEEIVIRSDAVMVARGDLGVEVDFEELPVIQKRLIRRCNDLGVPVITATQMLESMVNHSRPTRAEVTDVANAIMDGTDAVMLSGETAAGEFPIDACAVMAKIAFKTDSDLADNPSQEKWTRLRSTELQSRRQSLRVSMNSYADAIGQAVCRMAETLQIQRIVCFTTTGYTAAAIARYRPSCRITAITNTESTRRRCALIWGVNSITTTDFHEIDGLVQRVEELLLENGLAQQGETIIIVAGAPMVVGGRTNLLKLHTIGEA